MLFEALIAQVLTFSSKITFDSLELKQVFALPCFVPQLLLISINRKLKYFSQAQMLKQTFN